ncbi:hypothetical protein BDA99DRAFT_302108 [Phascolomyces articulosus]|uniref:Uncharacterized protein n=1 Tax=Phascolomyces articulosus TaxID=60185 RepID=A0AAD5KI91_9FUNG|nr:hypothetical protein BDA99DRAFT_302108 [Phascolomyces articulosus]
MDKQRILIPLLQRSPHLEFLLLGGGDDSEEDGALSLLDLTKFSVWCPKLVYLEINPDKVQIYGNTHYLHQQLTLNNNDHDGRPKEKGLRYFLVSEDEGFGPAQIGPLLKQHEGTLEYIGLEAYEGGTQTWAPVFQDLKLPQLHTLHCDGTLFDDKSMRALIREATSLQRLTIQGYDDEIHLNLTKLIKSCLQLKKLDFTQVRLSFDEDEALEDEDSTNDMISSSLSPEEHLSRYLDLNGSQLSDIKLEDVNGINDEFMQAVAHLSTLKSLEFVLDTDNVYTNDGVFEFLLKLQGTVIQVLDIYGIRHLSSPMCEAIANLKFLKRFRSGLWYGTQIVDGPALIKMVEKSESLTDIHLNHITVTGIEIDDQDREVDNENPLGICLTRQLNGFTVASLDFPDYYNIYITKN